MCGILVGKDPSEKQILSIAHRGIEHDLVSENGITMVHHRLPIQTLDGDSWSQPIEIGENRWLLFNGEIFNYSGDYGSDTEYLKDLFSSFDFSGLNAIQSLYEPNIVSWDGFWAIVLVDTKKQEIYAFTDPLGKKCLYINRDGEVCSEIKGLFDSRDYSDIDFSFFGGVSKFGYLTTNQTPYNDIKKLEPNRFYRWNLQNPAKIESAGPYYNFLAAPLVSDDYEERMDWLWETMERAVKSRLLSKNYPTSLLLSGGLDSSIIAGLLLKLGADVDFYSISNGEDEKYIKDCEDYWEVESKRLSYTMDGKDSLPDEDLIKIYRDWNESPIDMGSVIPQYHLFDAIKKGSKTRIVISGDGADELFGGYRRINEYDSQKSDVFHELTYYHLPRLDKLSMAHTLELRSPFLNHDIIRFALSLPFEERKNKKILKDTFKGLVPDSIIERSKLALKNEKIVTDQTSYRMKIVDLYLNLILDDIRKDIYTS
jgi:asparagine synthase (glutamine-hydrolysing)